MDTDQLLDLFETDASIEGIGKGGAGGAGDDEGALDETGQIKGKGASNPIGELGELWDEKDYEEEYNLDNFIQNLKV